MEIEQIRGEPSIVLGNEQCRSTITLRGGHLKLDLKSDQCEEWQSPYSLPPWEPSHFPNLPPLLQILRGDFFCFPFGVTEGSSFPHGETANRTWQIESTGDCTAVLKLSLSEMPGMVTKYIRFDKDNHVLYQKHVIEGVSGNFNYGHHPILEAPEGLSARYSCSPLGFGQVYPHGFAEIDQGEKSSLKAGARFSSLEVVEMESERFANLSQYPHEENSEDLVMLSPTKTALAWNAFAIPGFLWISIRQTRDFPSTLLWLSNGGRPQAPWNSQHKRRIGIEDVCSYFHEGAHRSRLNLLKTSNIPTSKTFNENTSTTLRHIQLVIPTNDSQHAIRDIEFYRSENRISILSDNYPSLEHPIDLSFFDN